jgi:hypothetical protein
MSMGVYIKGIEMSKSCGNCFFDTHCDNWRLRNWGAPPPDDCPLVPVPPHGRLIEADALEQDAQKRLLMCDKNDNQFQKPYEVMRAIALAPTIIPAEESKT